MKDGSGDYLNESNPSYLVPQSAAHHDDDDDDVIKTLQPAAAAAENTNDTSLVSSTQDNAEKPLLSRPSQPVPNMKYSALQQYGH